MKIKTMSDNLLTLLQEKLGNEYSRLSYVTNVSQNKFNGSTKRFGVMAGVADEDSGQSCSFTMNHQFNLVLTDSYVFGTQSQLNDNVKASKIAELQDKSLALYKDIAALKSTIHPSVLVINQLSIGDVEFLDEEKVAYLTFTINIRHKN